MWITELVQCLLSALDKLAFFVENSGVSGSDGHSQSAGLSNCWWHPCRPTSRDGFGIPQIKEDVIRHHFKVYVENKVFSVIYDPWGFAELFQPLLLVKMWANLYKNNIMISVDIIWWSSLSSWGKLWTNRLHSGIRWLRIGRILGLERTFWNYLVSFSHLTDRKTEAQRGSLTHQMLLRYLCLILRQIIMLLSCLLWKKKSVYLFFKRTELPIRQGYKHPTLNAQLDDFFNSPSYFYDSNNDYNVCQSLCKNNLNGTTPCYHSVNPYDNLTR